MKWAGLVTFRSGGAHHKLTIGSPNGKARSAPMHLCTVYCLHARGLLIFVGAKIEWMQYVPAPEQIFVPDCPPELEYLLQIDRFIVSLRGIIDS